MLFFGKTDVGRRRANNQDTFLTHHFEHPECDLCVVCDGMGGVAGGEVASSTAIQAFFDAISRDLEAGMPDNIPDFLDNACQEANMAVYRAASKDSKLKGMGTTLVAALYIDNTYYVINVGDSRLYCITAEETTQVTHDHTLVQALMDAGQLTPEEAAVSSLRSTLIKCVGTSDEVEPDIFTVTLGGDNHDTYILLCSDGLTNYLSEEETREILFTPEISLEEKVAMLIDGANAGGGGDNITAVVMKDN